MRRKKLFTTVLSLFMMLSLLPPGVLAEEEAPSEGFTAEEEILLTEELPEESQEEEPEGLPVTAEEEEEPAGEVLEEEETLTEEEEEVPEEVTEEEPAAEAEEEPAAEAEEEPISEPDEEPAEVTEDRAISVVAYDLWVGGVQVTSENRENITGDGISGVVFYDGDEREGRLYLKGAVITGYLPGDEDDSVGSAGIYVGEGLELQIEFEGSNRVSQDIDGPVTAIYSKKHLRIHSVSHVLGRDSLSAQGTGFGIYAENGLTIYEATVIAGGENCGIFSQDSISVQDSTVTASGELIGISSLGLKVEGSSKVTAIGYDIAGIHYLKGCNDIFLEKGLGVTEPEGAFIGFVEQEIGGQNLPFTSIFHNLGGNMNIAQNVVIEPAWTVSVSENNWKRGSVRTNDKEMEYASQKAYFKVGATGKKATVTAMPKEGCTFLNWTEDGTVVSTDPEYTFTVTGDRELVANFGSPWTGLQKAFNQGGEFALEADLTAEEDDIALEVPAGKSVILELNGHTLNRNLSEPKENGSVIINNGSLEIWGEGTLTGGYSSNSSTGGAITNNKNLYIYGGTYTGNRSWEAGAVFNKNGASVYVDDGVFSDNIATAQGGGAFVNYGSMYFYGGTIKNNTATRHGGAIWTRGELTVAGGRIVENTAHGDAGGINLNGGYLYMYGDPQIIDNYPNNVLIPSNNMIRINGILSDEARIGVTTNAVLSAGSPKAITGNLERYGGIGSFINDHESYQLFMYKGEASLFADFPEDFVITMAQEYVAVPTTAEEETVEFEASVEPAEWKELLQWRAEDDSGNTPAGITVTPNGARCSVKVLNTTTFWLIAEIRLDGKVYGQARCRVDVEDSADGDSGEHPIAYDLEKYGSVRLLTKSVSTKLYSTEYQKIQVLPELRQNNMTYTQAVPYVIPQHDPAPGTGVAVSEAVFEDEETAKRFFLRVADDRTLEVIPTNQALTGGLTVAKSYTSAIKLTIDGTEFTTDKLKLTVNKSLPTIKAKAVTVNSYSDTMALLTFTGGTVLPGNVNINPDKAFPEWLAFDSSKNGLSYIGEPEAVKKGKLYLQVKPEGWAVKRDVVVNVTSKSIPPVMSFKSKTLTLKPNTRDEASTTFTIKPAFYAEAAVSSYRVTEKGREVENALMVSVDRDTNTVRVTGLPTDGKAHTYKIYFNVYEHESVLTVKTLADTKQVTLKLTAKGAIDLAVKKSPVTITASTGNIRTEKAIFRLKGITDKSGSDMNGYFDVKQSGNVFTITAKENNEYTGICQAKIEADYGSGKVEKTVKFTVKKSRSAPVSLTLKTKGSIDVLRPGTAVTVTPVFKNAYEVDLDHEVQVVVCRTYDGASKTKVDEAVTDMFFIDSKDNKSWQITPKPGTVLSHKDKFTVRAYSKYTLSKAVPLKVVQGKSKIKQSTKGVTLLKTDRYSEGTVNLTLTDGTLKGIREVVLVSPKDSLKRDIFKLADLGNGSYAIRYNDSLMPGNIAKLKPQTVKLKVYLEGNETLTPNATLTVKVNFK